MSYISHQKYISEMEKNSKLFEEKMSKFKKYQKSSIYNEQYNYCEYDDEDFQTNKYSTKNKLHKIENKENFDEEGNNNESIESKDFSNNLSKNNKNKYRNKDYECDNIIDYENCNKSQKKKYNKNEYDKEYDNKYDMEDEIPISQRKIGREDKLNKNNGEIFGSGSKEKQNLQDKLEFNELHYSHEKISNELDEKVKKLKNQDEEIKNLKFKLNNLIESNKELKNIIKKNNDELDNLKVLLDTMKDEIRTSKNKYNDIIGKHKQLLQDYDNLNKNYSSLKIEKENLNSIIEEQKAELFNTKKEVTELNKKMNKLNNNNQLIFPAISNDNEEKGYNNYQRNKKEIKTKYKNNNDYNEKIYQEKMNKDSIKNNRNKYKNMDNFGDDMSLKNYNKDFKNKDLNYYEKKEEKHQNKYNNYNDEEYDLDKDNNQEKKRYNNIVSKYNYKNKKNNNNEEDYNFNKNNENNNLLSFGNNKREHYKEEMKTNNNLLKNESDYISIITEKNKIIGCDKDKMQTLINNREYQTVEKELSILIKEKDKLEGSLLKMPEHPRKLNDIRTKKEVNDIIERIEGDISYTRTMLKKTNDYYIKKI